MFLEPTEHIIVMEDDYIFPFSIDDLHKIEDAGIKTIMMPHATCLDSDRVNFVIKNTNLKVLIPFFYSRSQLDMRYYIDNAEEIVSLIKSSLHYYEPAKDRIQLIYAIPEGGEFLWDANMTKDFPVTDQELAKFIIDCQKILAEQHGEIWLCLHNFMDN